MTAAAEDQSEIFGKMLQEKCDTRWIGMIGATKHLDIFFCCCFLFADKNEERNQQQVRSKRNARQKKKESPPPSHREWQMTVITDHLRGGGGVKPSEPNPPLRETKSFRSTARQKSGPPLPPRLTSSRSQVPRLRAASSAAPSWLTTRRRGVPSRLRTDTVVVSTEGREGGHRRRPQGGGCRARLDGPNPCPAHERPTTPKPLPRTKLPQPLHPEDKTLEDGSATPDPEMKPPGKQSLGAQLHQRRHKASDLGAITSRIYLIHTRFVKSPSTRSEMLPAATSTTTPDPMGVDGTAACLS